MNPTIARRRLGAVYATQETHAYAVRLGRKARDLDERPRAPRKPRTPAGRAR